MINNIANMVKHQEDSIIHKKLMSSKSGSVTAFAIADTESIAEHKNRHCEFIFVLSGVIQLEVAGNTQLLEKGAFQSIKANTLHTVNGHRQGKFALIILKNKKVSLNGSQ